MPKMEQVEHGLQGVYQGSVVYDPVSRKFYQGRIDPLQGQIVGVSDISSIDIAVLLQEILGLERPAYNLRNVCRVVPMNMLKASAPVYTKLTAQEKVPEMTEAPISKGDWTTVDFSLWKNVVHIVASIEAQMRASLPFFAMETQDAAGALAASENGQIKTALETATTVAGHDWGTSTNNPYDDLIDVMSTIAALGYPPNFVSAHPLAWGDFFGNPYVKGQLAGAVYPDFTKGGGFPILGLPGVTGFSDFAHTNTVAIVGSMRASVLGNGPTEAAKYRNEPAGYDAFIIRQWLEPQLVVADAIRELTGVHA
jgi:hypothetical protein